MRVLHVINSLNQGGIASSLWHVLPHLRNVCGLDVEILALYSSGHFGRLLASEGVPVHCLGLEHKYDARAVPRLIRWIRDGGYDIVHAHGWPGMLFIALASLALPDRRYVIGEHNVTNRRRRRALRPLDRFIYSRYDHVTAISEPVRDALVAWLPETAAKTSTVPYGIEPAYVTPAPDARCTVRAELGLPDDVPVILSGGGLERQKGIDTLLHALANLASAQPPAGDLTGIGVRNQVFAKDLVSTGWRQPVILVAGNGAMRGQFEALARDLGLSDRVRFLGFRPDMPSLMAAADLFVLSSRWEGCPMVVLEAMAVGTPVVATRVGRVPELIPDGLHGRAVPPEDPRALADAIGWMLSRSDSAAAMADQAQAQVKRDVTVDAYARKLKAIYAALVDEPQST